MSRGSQTDLVNKQAKGHSKRSICGPVQHQVQIAAQVNKRGLKLQCSHYKPSGASAEHALPIVIYCHCNSGSRRDAEEAFYVLLPHNITVFCLDFAVSIASR